MFVNFTAKAKPKILNLKSRIGNMFSQKTAEIGTASQIGRACQ